MGDEYAPSLLTGFFDRTPKRGRPCLIDELGLSQRRDNLLSTLELHWAEVGWDLQSARTLPSLRKALTPLAERSGFELFVHPATRKTTWTELRNTRTEEEGLQERLRMAIEDEIHAREWLERVLGALQDSGDQRLKEIVERRRKQHLAAANLVSELRGKLEKCRDDLRGQKAYIAQSELLDFLRSKRYAITPLSLANAVAGVPFITWRRSATRCVRTATNHSHGTSYEMLEHIAQAVADPPRSADSAADQVKQYLLRNSRKGGYSISKLREEFYFLRLSIETAYAQHPPRRALPYRIVAEHLRRTSAIGRYDRVMQEEERL